MWGVWAMITTYYLAYCFNNKYSTVMPLACPFFFEGDDLEHSSWLITRIPATAAGTRVIKLNHHLFFILIDQGYSRVPT